MICVPLRSFGLEFAGADSHSSILKGESKV
jgi:hypothetical protein